MARQLKINVSFRNDELELYERLKSLGDTGDFIKRAALAMLDNGKGQEDSPTDQKLDLILAQLRQLQATGVVVDAQPGPDVDDEFVEAFFEKSLGS
jgi:hypothetical protein